MAARSSCGSLAWQGRQGVPRLLPVSGAPSERPPRAGGRVLAIGAGSPGGARWPLPEVLLRRASGAGSGPSSGASWGVSGAWMPMARRAWWTSRYGAGDRRPSTVERMNHSRRRLTGSIKAMPRSSWPPGAWPRAIAIICRARIGKLMARVSLLSRMNRSATDVARTSNQGTDRIGAHPSLRAASNAERSYQPSWRSTAPRSSSHVLTSMMIRTPVRGSNARRSIQPCERAWMISTSRAVSAP